MANRMKWLPVVMLVSLPIAAFTSGGWSVITLDDIPDHVRPGESVSVDFSIRRHGVTLDGSPWVLAMSGTDTAQVQPSGLGQPGRFRMTLTAPAAGALSVMVANGDGTTLKLPPIQVIPTGTRAPTLTLAERGERLFVAKGCVTCHVHARTAGNWSTKQGPELTSKRYVADYLAKVLADPSVARAAAGASAAPFAMPNLGLKPAEISALVAFINDDRRVTQR